MKQIVEYLQEKNHIFKSLKEVMPKELGSRKKIRLYLGVDLKGYYTAIFYVQKKSRVLKKEVLEYQILHKKLEKYKETAIKKKYMLINAPLCSKAKIQLEMEGWKTWEL